jgi:hypothetical protein
MTELEQAVLDKFEAERVNLINRAGVLINAAPFVPRSVEMAMRVPFKGSAYIATVLMNVDTGNFVCIDLNGAFIWIPQHLK